MKKFTWALVSTGRLEDGEKFYISLKGPDGEPWANPIEPEQIMQEIAALKQQLAEARGREATGGEG